MVRLIIAGGGTGGHVFPALAIAEAFRERDPENEVLFVGTRYGLEGRLIPEKGYAITFISCRGLKRKGFKDLLQALVLLPLALIQSLLIIMKFKPDLVLGVGGYSSGPVLLSAALLRKKTALHEQNSVAGLANRWVAPWVGRLFIHFPMAAHYFKKPALTTGNPIRGDVLKQFRETEKEGEAFNIFIYGGSQGARQINRLVMEALPHLIPLKDQICFYHQTGKNDLELMQRAYEEYQFEANVFSFSNHMGQLYKLADLVIGRAGAMTITELATLGRPSILIPLASAADNHQALNASYLEKEGACKILSGNTLNGPRLAALIRDLKASPETLKTMAAAAARLGSPHAAQSIVKYCYEYLKIPGELS